MNPAELPHDIHGLVPYEPPMWAYLGAVLVGLIAFIILYLIIRRFWPKRKKLDLLPVDYLKLCLQNLRSLEPQQPFHHQNQIQFYHALSMLFREYLELTKGIPATDLTTQELKARMRTHSSMIELDVDGFIRFLNEADLIKFADKNVTVQGANEAHAEVLKWVEQMESRRLIVERQKLTAVKNRNEVQGEI